jgi:hypothetical protein
MDAAARSHGKTDRIQETCPNLGKFNTKRIQTLHFVQHQDALLIRQASFACGSLNRLNTYLTR